MNNFLSLFEHSNFIIEYNGEEFSKDKLNFYIKNLTDKLVSIFPLWKDKLVYIDIKNRFLFFVLFWALTRLSCKIVFVPNEIKIDDYINDEDIFITDNKDSKNFIFIDKDLNLDNIPDISNKKIHNNYDDFYLYTSGSTGRAKLIPKKFENIYTEIKELKKILNIQGSYTFYFTPPLYHIYGFLFGFALPLYCNSKIIITEYFTPESIIEFIKGRNIDVFISIPHYYHLFERINKIEIFKGIKYLISSSAPLPIDLSIIYYKKGVKITEIYGSTETGGIAHRVSAIDKSWKLFSYVKVVNVDNNSEKELFITSPAISIFYDVEIGYNTGDIVKFTDDNSFILLGRNTRFSKIGGKRIDLNFVQNKIVDLLNKYLNIDISLEDIYILEKDKNIVMFYDIEIELEELKSFFKKHLPSYAVPRIFIKYKIPRNSMNKIDKEAIDKIYNNFISER